MSLINEMLKDLEKRKGQTEPVIPISMESTYEDYSVFRQHKIIIAAVIATLAFASIYSFRSKFFSSHQSIQQINLDSNNPATAPTATQNTTSPIGDVNITGVTLQTKENITELTFMLNHPALYEISTNSMKNQFTIIVEKSQLQSEIPSVNFLNSAIQSISANQVNGDTRFSLTLNPNATIKYVNQTNDDKNPELVIAIEFHPIESSATQITQHNSNVKTPVMQSMLLQKYQLALDAAKIGKIQLAISNLSSLLEVDPEYEDARASLAAMLLDRGNITQASKLIDEGLTINPGHVPFVELKARLLTQDGKVQQALNLLQSAVPPLSENPNYHALIAALYSRNNKDLLAIRTYQRLLALDPHNGSWWFGLAVSYDKLGNARNATSAYEHAMAEGHLNSESLAYLQKRLESLQEANNDNA